MYNQGQNAIVFMEVLSMNETLKTQLKILKLSDIKPNFSELARFYDLDRRTVKKYYDGYEGKAAHRDKANLINIMITSNRSFLSEVRMSALCMSSFFFLNTGNKKQSALAKITSIKTNCSSYLL